MKGHQNGQDLEHLPCEVTLEQRHLWEDLTGPPRCLQGGFLKRWTHGRHSGVYVFPIRPEPEWQLRYSTAWQAGIRNKVIVCKGAFNGNIRRIITSSEKSF